MEKKMTYVQAIDAVLDGQLTDEVLARLTDLRASLTKKTISQAQQDKINARADAKSEMHLAMKQVNDWMTIPQIMACTPALAEFNVQKVTSLLTDLRLAGMVDRRITKGRAYYCAL